MAVISEMSRVDEIYVYTGWEGGGRGGGGGGMTCGTRWD